MVESKSPEVIERVARALCKRAGTDPDCWPATYRIGDRGRPAWEGYEADARAVIEAMREPTAAMVEDAWAYALAEDAGGVWRAMIASLLGEEIT